MWGVDRKTGEFKWFVWYCRKKTCPVCTKAKARRNARRMIDFPDDRPSRHLLLTLKRELRPLDESVNTLFSAFRTLKKRKCWRQGVLGGVKIFGCEFDRNTGMWGPHFHLIVVTRELQVIEIAKAWQAITGKSWKVDLSDELAGPDRIRTIRYCANQIVQSFDDDTSAKREYELALKGRRLTASIGEWYGRLRFSKTGQPKVLNAELSSQEVSGSQNLARTSVPLS